MLRPEDTPNQGPVGVSGQPPVEGHVGNDESTDSTANVPEPYYDLKISPEIGSFTGIEEDPADRDRLVIVHRPGRLEPVYGIPRERAAYVLHPRRGAFGRAVLSIARAAHVVNIHFGTGGDVGSYFTPRYSRDKVVEPTLPGVMEQIAWTLDPKEAAGDYPVKTVELPLGELQGRESLASIRELLRNGIITTADRQALNGWFDRYAEANASDDLLTKLACAEEFNSRHPDSRLRLKVVRRGEGGVLVPYIAGFPPLASTMMVELSSPHGRKHQDIVTIAPGRAMPPLPIPRLHTRTAGQVDEAALDESMHEWGMHALIETQADQPPYIERTIAHLRSRVFLEGYRELQSRAQRQVLHELEDMPARVAKQAAKKDVQAYAAELAGCATVEEAKAKAKSRKEWELSVKAAGDKVRNGDGQPYRLARELYHQAEAENDPNYQEALAAARTAYTEACAVAEQEWQAILLELQQRQNDPLLIQALNAWGVSPDSEYERGHDGKGFNAALLHFIQYRASKDKMSGGRFDPEEMPEPFTVDGIIQYTARLLKHVKRAGDPDTPDTVAITEDTEGNIRYQILTPQRHVIIAFQAATDPQPRLSSTFPAGNDRYFWDSVYDTRTGRDHGQIGKLGADTFVLRGEIPPDQLARIETRRKRNSPLVAGSRTDHKEAV